MNNPTARLQAIVQRVLGELLRLQHRDQQAETMGRPARKDDDPPCGRGGFQLPMSWPERGTDEFRGGGDTPGEAPADVLHLAPPGVDEVNCRRNG